MDVEPGRPAQPPAGLNSPGASLGPQASGRLRFGEKFAVGAGGLPVCIGSFAVKSMAMPVYNMLLGVNPALVTAVVTIPHVCDAFIDPVIGHISDNLHSRFGRRRPFILVGAVAMALTYGSIWMVSPHWSDRGKLAYLFVTALVYCTSYAIFSVPYQSLTYELTPDYDERTSVMAHYSFWSQTGSMAFQWIFPLSQLAFFGFGSALAGAQVMNWAAAALLLGFFGLFPVFFGRERYRKREAAQPKIPFWPALRTALSTRPLLIVIALVLLVLGSSMVSSTMDYYLMVYYLYHGNIGQGSALKAVYSTAYAVVGFATIPFLNVLCRKFGRREAVIAIYGLTVVAGISKWILFRPGIGWWLLIVPLLDGPILATVTMVIPSMVADICDEDELKHGRRREGMFGAVFLWIQKCAVALAFFGAGAVLNVVGFSSKLGGAQSPETFYWMRVLLAGGTSVSAAIAIGVALFYPITRERATETRRQLEARRGAV